MHAGHRLAWSTAASPLWGEHYGRLRLSAVHQRRCTASPQALSQEADAYLIRCERRLGARAASRFDVPTAKGAGTVMVMGCEPWARITGVGAHRPRRVVTNEELCRVIDSSDEWIRRRSGIRTRRFADEDETLAMMAASAAGKALAQAGLQSADVDCVIAATMSYLYQAPPLASEITALLGAAPAAAFDVSAACSGFCHALSLARDMVSSGSAGNVVVAAAERMSDIVDPADRDTAFIFGDGAGAAVVSRAERPGIGAVVWGSDPAGIQNIRQEFSWDSLKNAAGGQWPYLRMTGPQVFRWAISAIPEVAARALAASGVRPDELAALIPHQANLRISEALATSLKLPAHVRIARDVVDMGNTSAASIPLAMDRMIASGEVPSGALALLIGFGSGMGYAAQVVELP
jgi:3-oxoacyl-[acyl-carrier-protein] synthase-3